MLNVLTISGGVMIMNKATLIAKMAEKSELSKKKAIVAKLCMSKPVDCIKVKAPVV